jgi:hypothetical protein
LQEFDSEKRCRLRAASEDIVDDIIVARRAFGGGLSNEGDCILDHCGVILREIKVLRCEEVNNWIYFDDSSVDTMSNEGFWGCSDSQAT